MLLNVVTPDTLSIAIDTIVLPPGPGPGSTGPGGIIPPPAL